MNDTATESKRNGASRHSFTRLVSMIADPAKVVWRDLTLLGKWTIGIPLIVVVYVCAVLMLVVAPLAVGLIKLGDVSVDPFFHWLKRKFFIC